MEFFQENTFLYNVTAGIVVLVLFLLVLKFVESLAKTLLISIGVLIVGYGLIKFFPNVARPVTKLLGSSWMDNEKSSDENSETRSESSDYYDKSTYYDSKSSTHYDSNSSTHYESYNYDGSSIYNDGNTYDGDNTYDQNGIYDDNGTQDYNGTHDYKGTYDDSYDYYENDIYYENNDNYRNVGE